MKVDPKLYKLAEEYADIVRALAIIESDEDGDKLGDGRQAHGLLQIHPSNFTQYYRWRSGQDARFLPSTSDTIDEAYIKCCATFFDTQKERNLDLLIQAWNLGVHGVFITGKRNPDYLGRFTWALNKIRAEKGVT